MVNRTPQFLNSFSCKVHGSVVFSAHCSLLTAHCSLFTALLIRQQDTMNSFGLPNGNQKRQREAATRNGNQKRQNAVNGETERPIPDFVKMRGQGSYVYFFKALNPRFPQGRQTTPETGTNGLPPSPFFLSKYTAGITSSHYSIFKAPCFTRFIGFRFFVRFHRVNGRSKLAGQKESSHLSFEAEGINTGGTLPTLLLRIRERNVVNSELSGTPRPTQRGLKDYGAKPPPCLCLREHN